MTEDPQVKCNIVVNNLLNKMMLSCDKQKLLIAVAELLYSQDKVISTQKVGRLLIFFGKLFETAGPKRCKYLQGSLFAIGGLLKLEAKSYLHTVTEAWSDKKEVGVPHLVCPLFSEESEYEQQEKQRVRVLSVFDRHFFEQELTLIMQEFIR
jgi:hypothetical protein